MKLEFLSCWCLFLWRHLVHLVPGTPGTIYLVSEALCRVHCTRYLYRLPRSRNKRPGSSYQVLVAGTRDPATGSWYQPHVPVTRYIDQVHGTRYLIPGAIAPVAGISYQIPGIRYQVREMRYQVPGHGMRSCTRYLVPRTRPNQM